MSGILFPYREPKKSIGLLSYILNYYNISVAELFQRQSY